MDNGVPPTSHRAAPRPHARDATATAAGQPADPRTEGVTGIPKSNGAKTGGNGAVSGNGRARSSATPKRAASKSTRTSAEPDRQHDPASSGEPSADGSQGASQPVATAVEELDVLDTQSRAPLLLPPIVPSEPDAAPSVPVVAPATVVVGMSPSGEFTDTDGTDGLPSLTRPKKPMRALRKPVMLPRHRPRVRRVTRVVRHVDSWSVFKVALVFNLFLYGVLLTAGVLLWQVAQNTGTVDNIERFFESFGWERFELKGGQIYHNAWIAGLFVVVGLTGLAVLMATLFNLITDLVGGIRVSVLEEEVVVREDRGLGWRRGTRRPHPSAGTDDAATVAPSQPG